MIGGRSRLVTVAATRQDSPVSARGDFLFLVTLGYSRDEVIGKFTNDLGLFVNPDDRVRALRVLEEDGIVRGTEAAIHVKDGSACSADTIRVGEVPCLLTTLVDITEHKWAEDLINDNYQFMQTLIQTIPIPVFLKNRTGAYSGCNKAFETWYGRSHDEIIGKTVFDVAPTEIAKEYFRTDEDLFNNPGTVQYESRVVSTNGQTRKVMINKATIVNSNGEATGIIGVISEIPEIIREEKITYGSGAKFSGG